MSLQSKPAPDDQRRMLLAVALITLIALVWMWMMPEQTPPPTSQEDAITDTSAARQRAENQAEEQEALTRQQRRVQQGRQARQAGAGSPAAGSPEDSTRRSATLRPAGAGVDDAALTAAQQGTAQHFVVETDRYWATFSTKGATLTSLELRDFDKAYDYGVGKQQVPVQLVDTSSAGALSLAFTTPQGHLVNTRALYFQPRLVGSAGGALQAGTGQVSDTLRLTGDSLAVAFEAGLGGGALRQVYTFNKDSYEVDLRVEQDRPQQFATADGYDLVWDGGLPFTEAQPKEEAQQSGAFVRTGGDVVGMRLDGENDDEKTFAGQVDWAATKNKYFTAALMPQGETRGAEIVGKQMPSRGPSWEGYTLRLQMPQAHRAQQQTDRFRLYLGPIDYYKLSRYDLDLYDMVDYGWDFFEIITRPIAKYFFIPIFKFMESVVHNYGIVIILLAVLVKTLVYPLTKSSYTSMAKMRELQPRMEAIREEYDDDQQKQQEEMMKMYKEEGANPLGGCLPMLLQYPVIITLYQFLPTAIDIRQQSFLWAHDLSVPDIIFHLPFTIPLLGDHVAGFTVLMGISMMVSMNLQSGGGAAGGQMKFIKYFFPIMIFAIFNNRAAGLSLYYLFYNIMTAAQQWYINYQIEKEDEAAGGDGVGSKNDVREARRQHRRQTAQT